MRYLDTIKQKFEELETETVGASFGGPSIEGRAPNFDFSPVVTWAIENIDELDIESKSTITAIRDNMSEAEFKYIVSSIFRFAFCIELTNLKITSTKMKTRWVTGSITKTRLGTFENYVGTFAPNQDQRSSSFEECAGILFKCFELLSSSAMHLAVAKKLQSQKCRGTPYESVFTYIDPSLSPVHTVQNIRLTELTDIEWLILARPLIRPEIKLNLEGKDSKLISKIATKCYKTDRSQTGEMQTNRAKRWECLSVDFQHASIEECWSVERKLLNELAHFQGFPDDKKSALIERGLFGTQDVTLCPITLKPMIFNEILGGGAHGESNFQVGHMVPLKAGGRHSGENIKWISQDGNRIQGSLSISATQEMLRGIFNRMMDVGILS
ncbi:hypothetical protein SAMN04488070_1560 [Pseudidiomarina maritima]|uniref:Uncharacterized protein n=1 Tax=Pseudidiomarina maritima TaxID=519453 RepID=A0A1I6H7S7_9GAMM|nr:hypothetical protein [Pseudidiomarina maritima]SFR50357.1 hypothetical protein SAMN04488070_1560 [Pseudidiomarina maritima]